jgi:AraC-like DNA-binding protein
MLMRPIVFTRRLRIAANITRRPAGQADRPAGSQDVDVLSDVMRAVRLKGAVFFDVRAAEPFISETPDMALVGHKVMPGATHVIPFHIVLRGHCWVESVDRAEPPVEMHEGDIIFYPQGHGHIFVSRCGDRLPPDLARFQRPADGRLPVRMNLCHHGEPTLRLVCGYLACDAGPCNPLLASLPSQVLARRPAEGNHIEVDLIYAAVAESRAHRAGGDAILASLSELLFVRVLRRYIESLPDQSEGWLAGLKDLNIGRALQLIHADPGRDWTLGALARESGLSRAVFAERFARCVGETPIRYLARWRMQVASSLLSQPGYPVEAIAEKVGYRSEASFNRAFKSIVGAPPGAWRRLHG